MVQPAYVTLVAVPVRVKDDTGWSEWAKRARGVGRIRLRHSLVNPCRMPARAANHELNEARAERSQRRAPVVQLDRTSAYEAESREFESLRARQFPSLLTPP